MFKALVIDQVDEKHIVGIKSLDEADLPQGNVRIAVEYSTINYKDGLLITGAIPLISKFPMVPGIDFAGRVVKSSDPRWKAGDRVLANGWGLGEHHWGGHAELAQVNGDWLVRIPGAFTTRQAMAIGTAGYTAMLCTLRLQSLGVSPEQGKVLVTGASGGVGSIAISILSKLGYTVVASTGRPETADYLKQLGAAELIDRKTLSEPGKPMQSEQWRAAIDTVGSHTLVNVIASLSYGGVVAATGLAQGVDLPATLYPFILRNVTLSGVDSVMQPMSARQEAWDRLAADLNADKLERTITEVPLDEAIDIAPKILAGQIRGRTVVKISSSNA